MQRAVTGMDGNIADSGTVYVATLIRNYVDAFKC
jgi:hypothetical protein